MEAMLLAGVELQNVEETGKKWLPMQTVRLQ